MVKLSTNTLKKYEVHYMQGQSKKVVSIHRKTMSELSAWLIASLYEGAFLEELTSLKTLEQAKRVADRRNIKSVRWNIATTLINRDRTIDALKYLP